MRFHSRMSRRHFLKDMKSQCSRALVFYAAGFLAALIAGCGGVGSDTTAADNIGTASAPVSAATLISGAEPVCGNTMAYSVTTSRISGTSAYPIRIYVPPDYAVTSDNLPIIYITDGVPDVDPVVFFDLAHVCRILQEKNIRAIVVGLTGQNRETDYTMPGAISFYDFLTMEVMPFVESKYRVDPTKRTLSGHSYGGLFVGLALTMDRPSRHYFANYVALDGSFWDQFDLTTLGLEALYSDYHGVLPGIKLVLSTITVGGNSYYVPRFYNVLRSLGFYGLDMTLMPPIPTTHTLMFDQGFSASLDVIFNEPGT